MIADEILLVEYTRCLHLNKKELVLDVPPIMNLDETRILHLCDLGDLFECLAPLLDVKGRDVDARHHEETVGVLIVYEHRDFSLAFFVVQVFDEVVVVLVGVEVRPHLVLGLEFEESAVGLLNVFHLSWGLAWSIFGCFLGFMLFLVVSPSFVISVSLANSDREHALTFHK